MERFTWFKNRDGKGLESNQESMTIMNMYEKEKT